MKAKNPMKNPETRALVSTKLRAMGWKPPVRCGNGGATAPQLLLACALGWDMEVAIPTGIEKGNGYPTCYKVDIGNADLKIAIEVDGNSHGVISRREEDAKKTALLESLGWRVLRFSNGAVMERLEECVQMVMSIISK